MQQNAIRSGFLPKAVMMTWDNDRYCSILDGRWMMREPEKENNLYRYIRNSASLYDGLLGLILQKRYRISYVSIPGYFRILQLCLTLPTSSLGKGLENCYAFFPQRHE